jgi:pyridoxine 4-dehydrogenase
VQNRYNLADRHSEGVLEACEREGIAFLPWFPLAFGELTRGAGRLTDVAFAHGLSRAQVAIAWLLQRSPVVLPIPGTSSLEHLEENVASASVGLTETEFADLSRTARAAL